MMGFYNISGSGHRTCLIADRVCVADNSDPGRRTSETNLTRHYKLPHEAIRNYIHLAEIVMPC